MSEHNQEWFTAGVEDSSQMLQELLQNFNTLQQDSEEFVQQWVESQEKRFYYSLGALYGVLCSLGLAEKTPQDK